MNLKGSFFIDNLTLYVYNQSNYKPFRFFTLKETTVWIILTHPASSRTGTSGGKYDRRELPHAQETCQNGGGAPAQGKQAVPHNTGRHGVCFLVP